MIVHLLEYQILAGHAAEVVAFVRHSQDGSSQSGPVSRCTGRRLTVDGPRYLVMSAWQDSGAFRVGTNAAGMPRDLASKTSLLRRRSSSQYRAVEFHGADWCEARVLRLYRVSVARDALDLWERSVASDIAGMIGLPGIMLALAGVAMGDAGDAGESGESGDVRILVLTAWRDWDALLEATGGRLSRPILGTELSGPQPHSLADHYERVDMQADGDLDLSL